MLKLFLCLEFFLLAALTGQSISIRHIHVNPDKGQDNADCYWPNSTSTACSSLDWALKSRSDGTHYLLSKGTHYLRGPVATFEGVSDVAFIGEGSPHNSSVISCATSESGIAFYNAIGITWINVTVTNCSSLRISTSKNFHIFAHNGTYTVYKFPVALYFNNCANVTLDQVVVEGTPDGTGVVMYNTFGKNTFLNSVFSNNRRTAMSYYPGGGGVYIEFTYCVVGDMNCYKKSKSIVSNFFNNTRSQYSFHNCILSNNKANSSDSGSVNSTYIVPFRADHVAFGRGGGLSIFMKGNASKNTFIISNCSFTNNSALWGAGLFVEFHDDTIENQVIVTETNFMNNFCYFGTESGTAGGGMRIGHYVYGLEKPVIGHGNVINVSGCFFDGNAAFDGGGLSISPTVEDVEPSQVATVNIINTKFFNNYGRLGAALHIDRFVMIVKGYIMNINVQDCTFLSNSIKYTEYIQLHFKESFNAFQTGAGAVYVNQVPIAFISQAHFSQNIGSAIAAVSTGVNFADCVAEFFNNKGNNGGAVALLGAAFIKVNQNSSLTFDSNEAFQLGGAIYNNYIEKQNLISYTNCFIRYVDYLKRPEEWTANFYFHDNTDKGNRSSAIYTTSILPCSRAGGSGISESKNAIFCWNASHWNYKPVPCSQQIFSDVGNISFSNNTETISDFQVEAFPGHEFTLPITVSDDLGTDVVDQTVFSARSGNISTYAWDRHIKLNGVENSSIPLQLDTVSERVWEMNINVELQPCPPGFKFVNEICVCAGHYIRAVTCDSVKFQANISENSWIGKVPATNTHYFASFCPPYYCTSEPTLLPNKSSEIEGVICGANNRQGIVCGECKKDFGVAINSPKFECVDCSENLASNIAAYIASVYVPLVLLFSAIIVFNIRLTSGPANAFILYSQVIAGLFDLDADGQILISSTVGNRTAKILDDAYRVVYGVFNLQFVDRFIPPLCVGKLGTLDVFMSEYAVALSPLVMIIIVLAAFKLKECCSSCCKTRRRNRIRDVPQFTGTKRTLASAIIPAFSAFLLLSYTKFSTISSYILLSLPLLREDGTLVAPNRVYYAGQYTTDDAAYKKYKITAYVVYCTFVAIPPLLLLDFPRRIFEWAISKFDCLWQHYPADKIQILLDTFQGCYKNKMRFFAGLYFVFRLVINLTYIYTQVWFDQYLVQQVACSIMVALLSICQPYNDKYKIFNVVDVLIFTNLGIINALSNFLLSQSNPLQLKVPMFPLIVQYILLYLPLIYMISYLLWLLLFSNKKIFIKILLSGLQKFGPSRYQPLQAFAANIGKTDGDGSEERVTDVVSEDEALLERAQRINVYRPLSRTEVRIENMDAGTATVRNVTVNSHGQN